MTDSKYRSKIDPWIGVLLVVVVIVLLGSMAAVLFEGASLWPTLIQELLLIGLIIFTLSLLLNTNYVISNESLYVHSGPFPWTIPLTTIELVKPSRKAWSSAALSLDRLYIKYQESKAIYISPEDKTAFMHDLASRAPELAFEIDRVVGHGDEPNV